MIRNGIDLIGDYRHLFKGRRLGLITNPTGVNRDLVPTADILARDFELTAVFGPEHGFRGDAQAGASVEHDLDPFLKVPVFSLYGRNGQNLRVPEEAFDLMDAVVYDIQDVGARFYTYIYALANAMEDAARHGMPVIVLDRINPLGGAVTEGILLDWPKRKSLIGLHPMPARYALTPGEYARYVNETFQVNCQLHVVPCDPHPRTMLFPQSGQTWVTPSPNLPTFEATIPYVGTCIFEGTNLSEGRGTTHPFEVIGAPFIQAERLAEAMRRHKLPGIAWRPVHFTPTFSKFQGQTCHGVQMHVTDPHAARAYDAGLWLFHEIRTLWPKDVETPTEHFNNVLGDDAYTAGREEPQQLLARARQEAADFQAKTRPFQLY